MPVRAILFDLDGTLIDQFQAIHSAFSQVIKEMGFPSPSFDEVKKAVGGASEMTMAKLIGSPHAKEAVRKLRPIFEKEMFNGLIALPGAFEVLKYCRDNKIKTAVLTNKHGPHARSACDHLGFSPYLEFTLGANDTEWKKPDRNLTQLALKRIGEDRNNSIYVGDSPYDYKTAENAGMRCLLVSTGTHSEKDLLNECTSTVAPSMPILLEKHIKPLIEKPFSDLSKS